MSAVTSHNDTKKTAAIPSDFFHGPPITCVEAPIEDYATLFDQAIKKLETIKHHQQEERRKRNRYQHRRREQQEGGSHYCDSHRHQQLKQQQRHQREDRQDIQLRERHDQENVVSSRLKMSSTNSQTSAHFQRRQLRLNNKSNIHFRDQLNQKRHYSQQHQYHHQREQQQGQPYYRTDSGSECPSQITNDTSDDNEEYDIYGNSTVEPTEVGLSQVPFDNRVEHEIGGTHSVDIRKKGAIHHSRREYASFDEKEYSDEYNQIVREGQWNAASQTMRDSDYDDVISSFFEESNLPDAILKLDRRHAIPRPRHKNDLLLEIEASTIDKRTAIRSGVRSATLQTTGIETTGIDCIGRVVQLSTHARAIYGISLDDRVAAIYPFDYKESANGNGLGLAGNRGVRRKGYNRYALVDAGFAVTVPKHVDGAEATTLIRLYMPAFQAIQLGIFHTTPSCYHDRYDLNHLRGQSILVQNGHTELGLAIIEIASLLGSHQIFATSPTEHHSLLREVGAVPLGAETFGWELFVTEKLSLVLVQDMPNPEIFEKLIAVLDHRKGSLVHIKNGPLVEEEDDSGANDIISEDVGCNGLNLQELAEQARSAISSAKFQIRLACCSQFLTYDGIWASITEDQGMWKKDLRFLLALLGEGNVKPRIHERICIEDVADTQDRIELYGNQGTIVCLPFKTVTETGFVASVSTKNGSAASISPENFTGRKGNVTPKGDDLHSRPGMTHSTTKESMTSNSQAYSSAQINNYDTISFAVDSGYVRDPAKVLINDPLSDFRYIHGRMREMEVTTIDDHDFPMPYHSMSNFTRNPGISAFHSREDNREALSLIDSAGKCPEGISKENNSQDHNPQSTVQLKEKRTRRGRALQRQKEAKMRWLKAHRPLDSYEHVEPNSLCQPSSEQMIQSKEHNSRFNWRKHRRNVRTTYRAVEQSNVQNLLHEGNPGIERKQDLIDHCFESRVQEDDHCDLSIDFKSVASESNSPTAALEDETKCFLADEQVCLSSDVQASSQSSDHPVKEPDLLHPDLRSINISFDPGSNLMKLPARKMESEVKHDMNIAQTDSAETLSSFRSIMSKWKRIEVRNY